VPAQRNGSAPPASGGSETPSLAGMDAANPAEEAASAAGSLHQEQLLESVREDFSQLPCLKTGGQLG